MGGDAAANAEVSGSGREETVSGTVGTAERPEGDVPPGLWQFARKKLREAYFHAARASVRDLELNPRPARDEDRLAADPPDPEQGVLRALSAIEDLAREPNFANEKPPSADDDDEDKTLEEASKNSSGTETNTNAKRRRKETRVGKTVCARFDASAKKAARLARADWLAAKALLLDDFGDASEIEASPASDESSSARRLVLAHLERAAESERRARWRTETITGRHSDLRRRAGKPDRSADSAPRDEAETETKQNKTTDTDAARVAERAWRSATGVSADSKDAVHALAYAEAAEETGRKPWVTEALRWCHDFAIFFLHGGGAAELAVKAERRRFFQERGERMTDAEITATREKFLGGHLGMDGDQGLVPMTAVRRGLSDTSTCGEETEKPKAHLLDVGSCWDYFRAFEDPRNAYEVVALDLAPRVKSVFRCDFLELAVGNEGSAMETTKNETNDTKFLSSYPANRASVVVLSLVLSYLPDPFMRGEMVRKARRVLLDDGRGILLIVTPHSTDRSYSNKNRTNALAVWRENIESLGFERVSYKRMRSVHCVAFRTVGRGPGANGASGRAPALPIAFDEKERE